MTEIDLKARHKARHFTIQALYQWQLSQENINEIAQQFLLHFKDKRVEIDYFQELTKEIPKKIDELDESFENHLGIPLQDLDAVELAVLRLACYEFKYRLDIPYPVVINEALELAKTFGSVDGYKFINGVLDKVAKVLRPTEIK